LNSECREEHLRKNRKHLALLLILTLFLTVVLSGCLGSEKKSSSDEEFWEHITLANKAVIEGNDFHQRSKETHDPTEQRELLLKEKASFLAAYHQEQIAFNLTKDPKKKQYVEYRKKALDSLISGTENLITVTETDSEIKAREFVKKYEDNIKEGLEWTGKAKKLAEEEGWV